MLLFGARVLSTARKGRFPTPLFHNLRCGLKHDLQDEDVLQIVAKTAEEQRHDKNYSEKVQTYYDNYPQSKKKKKPLKS